MRDKCKIIQEKLSENYSPSEIKKNYKLHLKNCLNCNRLVNLLIELPKEEIEINPEIEKNLITAFNNVNSGFWERFRSFFTIKIPIYQYLFLTIILGIAIVAIGKNQNLSPNKNIRSDSPVKMVNFKKGFSNNEMNNYNKFVTTKCTIHKINENKYTKGI